jgi:hypothetical protein
MIFLSLFFFNGSFIPFRTMPSFSVPHSFFTDGRTPWTSNQLVARPLSKHRILHRINAYTHQTSMPWMGFEPTIPASERAKIIYALNCSATVIGWFSYIRIHISNYIISFCLSFRMLYIFLTSALRAICTAHLILDLINLIVFVEMNRFLCMVSPSPEPILWVRYSIVPINLCFFSFPQ